jgi:hypothetical protein
VVVLLQERELDPVSPTRLPVLFALDAKLNIPDEFVYHPQCEALRRDSAAGVTNCGGDFANASFDGDIAGFGNSGSHGGADSGSHGAGDSSSGDSGGGDGGGGGRCGGGSCGGGSCSAGGE